MNQTSSDTCFGLCHNASDGQFPPARIIHVGNQFSEHEEGFGTEEGEKKKEMDALLCQAMNNLSLEERQKQQDILHGTNVTTEDAAMVDRALQDLDVHLNSTKQDTMYQVAERINPDYVHAKAFRVMFLRANDYDPKTSAEQMLRFFESKYEIFGIEKLVEDITLADLSEEDVEYLKTGYIQLAGRDKAGRQVIVHFGGPPGNINSWLRIQHYIKMRALEDEETQLRGIIAIWCAIGPYKVKNDAKSWAMEAFMSASAIPQKKQAIHICMDEMRQYILGNVIIKLTNGNLRARLRVHYGSQMECQYQMSAFGVPPSSIPLDANGRIELSRHLEWVQSCTTEDEFYRSLEGTGTPRRSDILFTGGKIINHLGNRRFHSVIQNYAQDYDGGTDDTKRDIVITIIDKMHESGGRFLKQQELENANVWTEVSLEELKKKIMQAFRNRRRKADASRRKADDCTSCTLISGEPLPNDVIFRRIQQRNAGSKLLHRLIKERSDEYESLGRGVKMQLVESIMQTIKGHGGRFLSPAGEPGRWFELSQVTARERISKCFRNSRRPPRIKHSLAPLS